MTVQSTAFAAHNLTLIHDLDAQPEPRCYVLFLHGIANEIHAEADESPESLWQRVLGTLGEKRLALAMQKGSLLDPKAEAVAYCGHLEDSSLERLKLKHMKAHIIEGLQREASGSLRDSTGTSRTNALTALSRILGLEKPRRKIVTKLTTPPEAA
jgi:hypothetical protein